MKIFSLFLLACATASWAQTNTEMTIPSKDASKDDAKVTYGNSVEYKPSVLVATPQNFTSILKDKMATLVAFSTPSCKHCRDIPSLFTNASEAMKGEVNFVVIDCRGDQESPALCDDYGIEKYPTFKAFQKEDLDLPVDLEGPITEHGLVAEMRKLARPNFTLLKSNLRLVEFVDQKFPKMVFFVDHKSPEYKEILVSAEKYRDVVDFGIVMEPKLFGPNKINTGIFMKIFDEKEVPFAGPIDSKHIHEFLHLESFPVYGEIGPGNLPRYIARGLPIVWVFLDTTEESSDLDSLAFILSAEYKGRMSFVHIDGVSWKLHAQTLGLQVIPGMVIQHGRQKFVYKYKLDDIDEIRKHCDNMLRGEATPTIKSEDIPVPDPTANVTKVVGESFEEMVLSNANDVFILFYAPWCKHCKRLLPVFDETAHSMKDKAVTFMKLDLTVNDIPIEVDGFPTMLLYKNGKEGEKKVVEFHGPRSVHAMSKFVEKGGVQTSVNIHTEL